MVFIGLLLDNQIFKLILASCTIAGVILAIIALIPTTRNKFFPKRDNKIKKQMIEGTNNFQAGGNINTKKLIKNTVDYHQSSSVGSQTIKGNNNKQAGGNINV